MTANLIAPPSAIAVIGLGNMGVPMGACLVMLGVGLMIIPMWMVSRHIDDLVDAMSHLFG